jgi:hypothetical protein
MAGTFWGEKSPKVLSNKVFRFIQQTLDNNIFSDRLGRARKPTKLRRILTAYP